MKKISDYEAVFWFKAIQQHWLLIPLLIFATQMLRENVKKLDAVIFTHPHKDHIAGLDDVKAYNFFQKKPMDVYANALTQDSIEKRILLHFC